MRKRHRLSLSPGHHEEFLHPQQERFHHLHQEELFLHQLLPEQYLRQHIQLLQLDLSLQLLQEPFHPLRLLVLLRLHPGLYLLPEVYPLN